MQRRWATVCCTLLVSACGGDGGDQMELSFGSTAMTMATTVGATTDDGASESGGDGSTTGDDASDGDPTAATTAPMTTSTTDPSGEPMDSTTGEGTTGSDDSTGGPVVEGCIGLDQGACTGTAGCVWTQGVGDDDGQGGVPECRIDPNACAGYDDATCAMHFECIAGGLDEVGGCGPAPCSTHLEAECETVAGCTWIDGAFGSSCFP